MFDQDNVLSVSDLNDYVRRLLSGDVLLRNVSVIGEISGYKQPLSGHRYFTLKDENARVQCVMFRQDAYSLNFVPDEGTRVQVTASASLYPQNGTYQLYVKRMNKVGLGELYVRFEALKRKLEAEGLFDPAIKKELPVMPSCIGIVTSLTGAAVRDMVRITHRRNPNVTIIIAPCLVQGSEAAAEIENSIRLLNKDGRCDVLLIGRGGGSIEDLWAFNEERVARAIAESKIPTISCVGHETDFTIADFVADARAATPSMAAEIAVPVIDKLRNELDSMMKRIVAGLANANRLRYSELNLICNSGVFRNPGKVLIETRRETLERVWNRCTDAIFKQTEKAKSRVSEATAKLAALNPESVLSRGYTYVTKQGKTIVSVTEIDITDRLNIRFADGSVDVDVYGKEEK